MNSIKSTVYKKDRLNFIFALLGSIGNVGVAVGVAFLLREFVGISISGFMDALYRMLKTFVLLLPAMMLVDVISFIFTNRFIHRGMRQYKYTLFKGLPRRSTSSFQKEVVTQCMSALSNDATVIEKNDPETIFEVCTYGMTLAAGLGSMLYLDSHLTICAILVSVVSLLVSVFFSGALRRVECCTSKYHADFIALLKDLFSGFTVIKSFQVETIVFDAFEQENAALEKSKKRRRDLISILMLLSQIFGFLVNLVVFGLGIWLCTQGRITAGTVIASVQLLNYIILPIEKFPALYSTRKVSAVLMRKGKSLCIRRRNRFLRKQ